MNIIFNGFHDDITSKVEEDIERNQSQNFSCKIVKNQTSGFKKNTLYLNYLEISYGVYPSLRQSKSIAPSALTALKPESKAIVLKMMDRLEKHMGPLSDHHRQKLLEKHLHFWNEFLVQNNINCFISSNIPHEVYDYVIYLLCQERGIKCINIHQSIPNFTFVFEDLNPICSKLNTEYKRLVSRYNNTSDLVLADRTKTLLDNQADDKTASPVYMKANPTLEKGVKSIKQETNFNSKRKLLFSPLFWKAQYYRRFQMRYFDNETKKLNEYYHQISTIPDLSLKYVYLPLHFQPELTTSPLAGKFVNQHLIVENLLKGLPNDIYIYVKEHPKQSYWGRKSIDYYRRLLSSDRVVLVPKDFSTYELIANAFAVATATGTAGWEAVLRKKPVFMFGDFFYRYAKGVYHVKSIQDTRKAYADIIGGKIPDDYSNKVFLKAFENISIDANHQPIYFTQSLISKEENKKRLAQAIMNELKSVNEIMPC